MPRDEVVRAAAGLDAIKAIAIARQYVEEEAIDLCFRPEFVEIAEAEVLHVVSEASAMVAPLSCSCSRVRPANCVSKRQP